MSGDPAKRLNETITLDSSCSTDVIECSVEEVSDRHNFFKTPRSCVKRTCYSGLKNEVISLKSFQFRSENVTVNTPGSGRLADSVRCKLQSSPKLNESVLSEGSFISSSITENRKGRETKKNSAVNSILSSLKKTPDLQYLSKSKINRIEKWLTENDVETVRTPPFSKLNGTPVSRRSNSTTKSTSSKKSTPKRSVSDSSSVDSEVNRVLVAVYGNDWRQKNVIRKSKTEPRRNKRVTASTKTDIKTKGRGTGTQPSAQTVRRNIIRTATRRRIIDNEKSDDLDNSFSLGVQKLNESASSESLVLRRKTTTRRRRKLSSSSSDSWIPVSEKKKNIEEKSTTQSVRKTRPELAVRNGKNCPSPGKTPMKSFLASLSVSTPKRRCHPEAQDYKINFKTKKEELAQKLFKLYNKEVFEGGLPEDMNISWNVKLRGTAGYCYNKKILKSTGQVIRISRVEFSTKIIDRADRLRDTMIHELCHAASWVIDGVLDGHGSFWTRWSRKAMDRFPELPPIKRCHNYEIASKYTYKCSGCGYSINRHSKSIDIERKRCGYCFGVLELFVNKKKRGKGEVPEFDSTRTLPAPNNFALFVKENYHNVKNMQKDAKHAEIMKILSQKYALTKNNGTDSAVKK